MLQDEDVDDTPICIHKVPQILRALKPDAYDPQLVGLGPYHHWREDLYGMEQAKLVASKKSQKACQNYDEAVKRLEHLVNRVIKHDIANVRASYDRNLVIDDNTLAWMMVVDSIFLLQFLQVFMRPNESCLPSSPRTSYLIDPYQSAYHSIIKDIMKLENQIPILSIQPAYDIANEALLPMMLLATCMNLSPLKIDDDKLLTRRDITRYAHLLELLYYLIVPEADNSSYRECRYDKEGKPLENQHDEKLGKNCFPSDSIPPFKFEMVSEALNIQFLHVVANSKPIKVIGKMTGVFTAVLPSFSSLLSSKRKEALIDPENGGNLSSSEGDNKGARAPKVEEITIPSVSNLQSVGIEFCPIRDNGPITCIEFDKKTKNFHLPTTTINDNTEVIIRNLVAYEAQAISGPSVLARYTELMNGIIDNAEDVRLLRESNIMVHYLKKDEDVAQLWNGMSRSIRLSHFPSIDKAIKEVNEYYENKRRVKFYKITKGCLFCGWRILMLLLALVLMVLMSIQSFCDVYKCPRALRPVTTPGS